MSICIHKYIYIYVCTYIWTCVCSTRSVSRSSEASTVERREFKSSTLNSKAAAICFSNISHDAFRCMTWRIYMWVTTHPYVCHDPSTFVPWLLHMCTMTHVFVRRLQVKRREFKSWTMNSKAAMGWLWMVGSIKLHVSFAKEPYKREDILQKRPVILRSLPIVATPYKQIFSAVSSIHSIICLYRVVKTHRTP